MSESMSLLHSRSSSSLTTFEPEDIYRYGPRPHPYSYLLVAICTSNSYLRVRSFFKTLIDHEVTVELKNDIRIRGTLKSVDQYLNIKLDDISVVDELQYPHLVGSLFAVRDDGRVPTAGPVLAPFVISVCLSSSSSPPS